MHLFIYQKLPAGYRERSDSPRIPRAISWASPWNPRFGNQNEWLWIQQHMFLIRFYVYMFSSQFDTFVNVFTLEQIPTVL